MSLLVSLYMYLEGTPVYCLLHRFWFRYFVYVHVLEIVFLHWTDKFRVRPKDINKLSMQEITDYMKEQFDPKRFIIRERFKFWSDMLVS